MPRKQALWVVIAIYHSAEKANAACERLTGEGFMARVNPISGDISAQTYEIQCLSSEAVEARTILSHMDL